MLVFGIVSLNISCETLGESFQTWFSFLGNFLEMCVYTYTHLSVFLPSSQFFLDFLLVRCWVSGACFSRVIFSVIWAPRSYSLATKEASSCTRHQEARLQLSAKSSGHVQWTHRLFRVTRGLDPPGDHPKERSKTTVQKHSSSPREDRLMCASVPQPAPHDPRPPSLCRGPGTPGVLQNAAALPAPGPPPVSPLPTAGSTGTGSGSRGPEGSGFAREMRRLGSGLASP